ncbi:hypothetical protein HWV62_44639 [Athelia sp. TMB]|nr:hypothetical protein HWV62_44639 [Athelia sp. TMB]
MTMIVSKPAIIFYIGQIFFNFLAMACFASVASFQAKWGVGPSGLTGFAVFVSVAGIVLSTFMLFVPVIYEKYDKLVRLARAMQEVRVGFILAGSGATFSLLISFIVTISAWTEAGCKNPDNDPNAKKGDAFKAGLSGWCSTKKAGAIFFWLTFGFWLASLTLLIMDWRSGKLAGPRDPPFNPPEAHEEGYAYGHEEEEEESTAYSSIPPVSQRQTTYDDTGAAASPFADPSRYRDSDATAYSPAPAGIPAGRPSMDAYGAFSDPAPSGFGTGSPGGYAVPAPAPATPPPPPQPAVSRTMHGSMSRDSPQTQSSSSTGLLSGVFSFVSREIESFVATATGGEVQAHETGSLPQPGAPPAGNLQDAGTARRRERKRQSETSRRLNSEPRKTPSPPPVPRYPSLLKVHPVTMPGSLFPRSPSLMPESPPRHQGRTEDSDRHVHFTPPGRQEYCSSSSDETETEAGPSRPRTISRPKVPSRKHPRSQPSSPRVATSLSLSPLRSPSVKEAVKRFRVGVDDADASLLLPKETVSPKGKGKEREIPIISLLGRTPSPTRHSVDKGKQRASRPEPEVEPETSNGDELYAADTSEEVRVKGIERELLEAKEEQTRKEQRWERDRDKARQEDEDQERAKDKDRIKMLEEEILRLKEELSRRRESTPAPHTSARTLMLPPPPPPPPPPQPRPEGFSTRPLTSSAGPSTMHTSAPGTLFASARAALKQTAKPVEAPINFGGLGARTKRQGQPTVNIDGEKMAAFLTEMKSVRLRKTGPTPHAGPRLDGWKDSAPERDIGLTRSWSAGGKPGELDWRRRSLGSVAGPSSILARHGLSSFRSLENRTETAAGEKRKRDSGIDEAEKVAKRRTIVATPSSSVSSREMAPPPSENIARHPNRTWPSLSTETDLTTPELLSDNENEGDFGSSSLDDRLPSTPPSLRTAQPPHKSSEGATNMDVDVRASPRQDPHLLFPPEPARQPASPHMLESELFSKRPPKSPLPLDSPRRPRPPARPLNKSKPYATKPMPLPDRQESGSRVQAEEEDDEDPLSLSFTSPDEPLPVPKPKPQPSATASGERKKKKATVVHEPSRATSQASATSQTGKQGNTLDQELRDARARSLLREHDLLHLKDLQSGEFVGVGTRKKTRGFLAHGGSGGTPVLMGEGYVDGVEPSEDESDYQPRRSTLGAGAARRKNRR